MHIVTGAVVIALLLGTVGMMIDREVYRAITPVLEENELLWEENALFWEEIALSRAEENRLWEEITRTPKLTVQRKIRFPSGEWSDELEAKTGQSLEFSVTISADSDAHNVWVRSDLPQLLFYRGNLKVDGVSFYGDITEGVNIGTVTSCETRIVTFDVATATASMFPVGKTSLTAAIDVWADCAVLDSGEITIVVERKAPAPSGGGSTSRPRYDNNKPGGPGPDPTIPKP